jgi:hypothetical protein
MVLNLLTINSPVIFLQFYLLKARIDYYDFKVFTTSRKKMQYNLGYI